MENIVIPQGYLGGEPVDIPIFILRLNSCVYEFVRIRKGDGLIGRTMVTQSMWNEIMGYNPSDFKGNNIPVNNVSSIQIEEFISKLTELTSEYCGYRLSYRLMREEEYELAAGTYANVFNDSDTIINAGLKTGFGGLSIWCSENSGNRPHEVAMTPPNEHGLYDMYGNIWEMCQGTHDGFIPIGFTNRTFGNRDRSNTAPKRFDFDDDLSYRRAMLKWKLLYSSKCLQQLVLKGGAWNMPKENCVKETFLEIGENDKFSNAGFRICVSVGKIE